MPPRSHVRRGSAISLFDFGAGVALLFLGGPASAALVQSASRNNDTADLPMCSATFPLPNTPGNTIIVAVEVGSSATDHSVVVHDTLGNTYYPATAPVTWRTDGGGSFAQLFYASNIRGGSNTVSLTEPNQGGSGAGNAYNQIAVHEYSCLATLSPLDGSATAAGVTATEPFLMSSGAAATKHDGDLIFAYGNAIRATLTPGAGFTPRETDAGLSEDLVQPAAGPIAAVETNNVKDTPFVMLMAAFKTGPPLSGPTLPAQPDVFAAAARELVVTNTGTGGSTNLLVSRAVVFDYTNRAALLADGWSFVATSSAGRFRDTEVTNGPTISFDQVLHPGELWIPCDTGLLFAGDNNSRNSLFRDLPANWVSVRLHLSFAPTLNYQQAYLAVYQNDDNYVGIGLGYNSDLAGEIARHTTEKNGAPTWNLLATTWLTGGPHTPPVTNIYLRLDKAGAREINSFASVDGVSWAFVAQSSLVLTQPRLALWVGGSPVPYTNGLPQAQLQRLELVTTDPGPPLTYRLLTAPTGATIDANGLIRWTPTPAQSPSTNLITTVVSDQRPGPLRATNSFKVIVAPASNP